MTAPETRVPQPCQTARMRFIQAKAEPIDGRDALRCPGCQLCYAPDITPVRDLTDLPAPGPGELQIMRISRIKNQNFWLKALRAVNLDVHCEHALTGKSLHVDKTAAIQTVPLAGPVAGNARAYYLCGVTKEWTANSHLLLVPDPSVTEVQTWTTATLAVRAVGLRRVEITETDFEDRYKANPEYTTCRNLRAAWTLYKHHGFPHDPGKSAKLAERQALLAQQARVKGKKKASVPGAAVRR